MDSSNYGVFSFVVDSDDDYLITVFSIGPYTITIYISNHCGFVLDNQKFIRTILNGIEYFCDGLIIDNKFKEYCSRFLPDISYTLWIPLSLEHKKNVINDFFKESILISYK
jgi:hypothetical protein